MKYFKRLFTFILLIFLQSASAFVAPKHTSTDPKMAWWKEAKFGLFIHWGLYCVPAGSWQNQKIEVGDAAEWIQSSFKIPPADYKPLAGRFNPVKFDAEQVARLAQAAGMKYIVLTSKHHEGFAMFKSTDPFNIVDATPYKKDVVKALADACKKHGLRFGLYYSQAQDWNHPGGSACSGHWHPAQEGSFDKYLDDVAVPQVKDILSAYHPDILWWDTPCDMTPERAAKFTSIIAAYPKLITNNRLGGGIIGDFDTPEQQIPATGIAGKNWEACMTMNHTWGFSGHDHDWKSSITLIQNLIDIVSKGGNYLLNVGPTSEGLIPQPSIERLQEIGRWLAANGEAIYGSGASPFSEITWGRVTQKKSGKLTKLYLHVFDWPSDGKLVVPGLAAKIKQAYPLASAANRLLTEEKDGELYIDVSQVQPAAAATVIVLELDGNFAVYNRPEITAESVVFIDTLAVEMTTEIKNGVVRYTTDGSLPDANSPQANGRILMASEKDLILRARAFVRGQAVSGMAVREFFRMDPLPSLFEGKAGLRYKYYQGVWRKLPDFARLTPVKTGVAMDFLLKEKQQSTFYALVFDGYIQVPETDVYTFFLTSNDGSKLIIDDVQTLDHDGLHGMAEKELSLALSAGLHKISLHYFQNGGGDGLALEWRPNGQSRRAIDASLFLH